MSKQEADLKEAHSIRANLDAQVKQLQRAQQGSGSASAAAAIGSAQADEKVSLKREAEAIALLAEVDRLQGALNQALKVCSCVMCVDALSVLNQVSLLTMASQ